MPSHVHLILVPDRGEALGRAVDETHRRYSAVVNARKRVTGHVFQSSYGSVVEDEDHLLAAARYVALDPVRARLASARKTGAGRASAPIWGDVTTASRSSPRCSSDATGGSATRSTRPTRPCAARKRSAARS